MILLSPEHDCPAMFTAPEWHIATTSRLKTHGMSTARALLFKKILGFFVLFFYHQ